MADAFEAFRAEWGQHVDCDFFLGGVNVHATQNIGDWGQRMLMRLWQEVHETTGQQFSFVIPDHYVHNSMLPCLAVEAVRQTLGPPAGLQAIYHLQRSFFALGQNITDLSTITESLTSTLNGDTSCLTHLYEPSLLQRVRFQFEHARSYGTQALPAVLIGPVKHEIAQLRLLAGGFVDAPMLGQLVAQALPADIRNS